MLTSNDYLLPFSYTLDQSIEVYQKSLEYSQQSGINKVIHDLAWINHSMCELIPSKYHTLFSGHRFPAIESFEEIQISYNLCFLGFYKQALISLRSGLETGLLSVYWNINDDGHEIIKGWLNSVRDTPRLSEIWKNLEKHQNFKYFQNKYDIKSRLLKLNYLHDYVHTKGHRHSNRLGMFKGNFQTFEEEGINKWSNAYQEVVKVLLILHLIKYPIGVLKYDYSKKFGIDIPSFGGLQISIVETIEKILGSEISTILKDLLERDEDVQGIMKWIESLPDMTSDEVEEQIINMNKIEIEWARSFKQWYKFRKGDEKFMKNEELIKYRKRIELLKDWAAEKGL